MARTEFQDELSDLRGAVHDFGDLALQRVERGADAFASGDDALARRLVEGDRELNDRYLELEGECVDLLALQQPVASDLRLIVASFKVLTDVERVGDLAVNLAEYGLEGSPAAAALVDVEDLAGFAAEMVADALDAYAVGDVEACREIADRDDELDERCRAASEAVVRGLVADDPATLTGAEIEARLADVSTALLAVRDVERIGDHAVNVAARTLYMAEHDDELIY